MASQKGRLPRQELQLMYETTIELLQQFDPDRIAATPRDPGLKRSLERVREHFGLKQPAVKK